jgi:hypothetical protein
MQGCGRGHDRWWPYPDLSACPHLSRCSRQGGHWSGRRSSLQRAWHGNRFDHKSITAPVIAAAAASPLPLQPTHCKPRTNNCLVYSITSSLAPMARSRHCEIIELRSKASLCERHHTSRRFLVQALPTDPVLRLKWRS